MKLLIIFVLILSASCVTTKERNPSSSKDWAEQGLQKAQNRL